MVMWRSSSSAAFKLVGPWLCSFLVLITCCNAQKIAIIGGGISGTFTAKYLTDYDVNCTLDAITIFEPVPVSTSMNPEKKPDDDWQGSRVASVRLKDGSVVELGASIAYKGFHLVIEMIRGDPTLQIGPPFNTGADVAEDSNLQSGFGILDGFQKWGLFTGGVSSTMSKLLLIWRYNYDLVKVSRMCQQAQDAFANFPHSLDSLHPDTFFGSPDDLWDSAKLTNAVHNSFDAMLDQLGIPLEVPWYRRYLPYQGSLRKELLTAINLVNYNQNNAQANALVGLGSFAATSGGLFSIVGGNYQIIQSAKYQATTASLKNCKEGKLQVEQEPKRITSVIGGSASKLTLFSDQENLGDYDIVVLAAPLQHARIQFRIQSHFDSSVLQPMPLAGMVDTDASADASDGDESVNLQQGHDVLPAPLPDTATRPYTQVVTTVVANATLSAEYLGLGNSSSFWPRSIMMTSDGKASLYNITAITQIASAGTYKVFSNERLSAAILEQLFGPHHSVGYVKLWGGPHGGATPDYRGGSSSLGFLLYDGAVGFEGHTTSGAVYYPNAMEQSSLSCMEVCAVGARAVAKLIARRVGLIEPLKPTHPSHQEL